jgi:hypothetical protein
MEESGMSDAPQSSAVPEADRKLADQIIMVATIVAGAFAVVAVTLSSAGFLSLVVFAALAAGLWFGGVAKIRAGDLKTAKMTALATVVFIGVFGFGLGSIFGLLALATCGALIYAAMLLSPGRKLF